MDIDDSERLVMAPEGNCEFESGSTSDDYVADSGDDEICCDSGSSFWLQSWTKVSKATWIEELGMAEVLEKRGKLWIEMGIKRGGKTYCSLEETLFLVEIGALTVLNDHGQVLQLNDIYGKLAEDKNRYGCSWESFEVYRYLKFLGYVVGRRGIPWSLKNIKVKNDAEEGVLESDRIRDEGSAVLEMFCNLTFSETRPLFNVYSPDTKFKKSSPGSPSFILCLISGLPPSNQEIEDLEARCRENPLKFCIVEHGRVSFLSFTKVNLSVLP